MTPPTQASTEKSPESREGAASKRIRLSLACNQCRKRKVRCDTETPKCRNCWLRDEVCETTDPRYPENGPSVRRWATKDGLLPGQNPAATHRNQAQIPKHSSASFSFAETVASDQDRGDADRAHGKDTLPRRWSTSVSVSAATESTTQLRDAISASPAGTTVSPGSSAGAGAMSWVSRGYQTSISAGGGGEASAHDNDPSLVVNAESASSHRVKVCTCNACLDNELTCYLCNSIWVGAVYNAWLPSSISTSGERGFRPSHRISETAFVTLRSSNFL